MEQELNYNVYPGGNDVFAYAGGQLLITDLDLGSTFTASVVDFYIDDVGTGYVYIDGETKLSQEGIVDYSEIENMFYSIYSITYI